MVAVNRRETHQILKQVAEEDSKSGEDPSSDAKKQNSLPPSLVTPEPRMFFRCCHMSADTHAPRSEENDDKDKRDCLQDQGSRVELLDSRLDLLLLRGMVPIRKVVTHLLDF